MHCMLFVLRYMMEPSTACKARLHGMGSLAQSHSAVASRGPCVLHGGTATTAVLFEACLEVQHSLS